MNPYVRKRLAQYLKIDVQTDCASRSHHHKGLHVAIFKLWPYCEHENKIKCSHSCIFTI